MLDPADVAKVFRASPAFKTAAAAYLATKWGSYPPNPYFVMNGVDGATGGRTARNLKMRKLKGVGSTVFSAAGTVGAHLGSVVNTATIAKHVASEGSTILHGIKLNSIAKKIRDGGSLAALLDYLIKNKAAKGTMRAVKLGMAAIPDVGLIGTAVGLGLTAVQAVKFRLSAAADLDVATRLHWQAYRELVLLGGSKKATGPALSIFSELLTRGVTGRFDFGDLHSEEVNRMIIREANGYAVLLYKLQQG